MAPTSTAPGACESWRALWPMTMISEFGDGSAAAPMIPICRPGYRSRSSFAGSALRSVVRAGEASYSPGPGRWAIPGGTGALGPAAARSTRSIAWLSNWSVPDSHHSPSDVEVDGGACAEVSSHAPRSVWACSPLNPASEASRRPTPRATAAAVTRTRECGFTSASERQAQAEPNHPATAAVVVTLPSRTMTSRSA